MTDQEVDDFLEHHGVLGMKWGHTRARANGSDIRSARRNVHSQKHALNTQKKVISTAGSKNAVEKEQKKYDGMKASFLKNPDRVTAARLTRGEKAAVLILTGVATPATAAIIGGTSARSRRIEQKQDTGAYNKKK